MGCKDCALKNEQQIPYRGNPDAEVVFILESPGYREIEHGKMLIGKSLDYTVKECNRVGLDFNSLFLMNAARCRIDKNQLTDAEQGKVLKNCRPNVEVALSEIKPKLIVCFGAIAFRQIMYKSTLKKARNQFHWSNEFNCWVFCTYHPAAIMRDPNKLPLFQTDFDLITRFIKKCYEIKDETTYKEVESIRSILDGNCYKEGDFYLAGIDTETQGVNWYDPNSVIISYQVSKNPTEGWTIILHEECEKDQGDFNIITQRGGTQKKPEYKEVGVKKTPNFNEKVAELKELLERNDIKKYFFNQKFEQHRFMNLGITEWANCCMDARIASHCLDSELYRDCSLEDLISQFTASSQSHKGEVSDAEKEDMFLLLRTDREKFIKYASLDSVFTLQVCLELRKELLKDQKSLNYFIKFAQPIENEFLFEMERNGVLVDRQKIPEIKEKLNDEIRNKEKQFKKHCPPIVYHRHKDNFKLTRTIILQEALFEWTDKKAKKGEELENHNYGFNLEPIIINPKAGTPSTDKKQVLNAILDGKYPKKVKNLVQTHMDWNERRLFLNNFIKNIEKYLDENDRLHANFSITFSSSGRTGVRNPSLQNQPKRSLLAKLIRSLFISPEGFTLAHCDYNASELRWVAHVAQEKEMAKIFKEGKDPHRITGLEIRGLPEDYVFKTEKELKDTRQDSKPLSFGLIYLMSVFGLKRYAKQGYGIEYTDKQAQEKFDRFFRKYCNIPKWHENAKEFLHKYGFLRTVFGRKRNLPKVWSEERKIQMQAERTGINMLIQGPSSDATLLGGYNILKDERVKHDECKITLSIHDALIFEIAQNRINYYIPIIKYHMENIPTEEFGFKLTIPLIIEAEVGNRLSNLKEVEICEQSI